ncbi:protein of unknown function [Pseudomonas asplenii]|uniref:DUF4260 family protein n=1 Tax=Pseudomonas asplenii TaxID=53407 RepID=A0A1H1ZAC8_9PSED|nr:DUF4260 domain-containing protein [Pseudomonas asplenii]SDT30694.1 protein of unknown function [Pseudomonas asplenii]
MSHLAPSAPHTVPWQRVEGGLLWVTGVLLFWQAGHDFTWWTALVIFFMPDLSILGYALGPKVGAYCYNTLHLYGVGAALLAAGLIGAMPALAAVGALWLAHAGFDRMLGYGLKSPQGFTFTHLGVIGR